MKIQKILLLTCAMAMFVSAHAQIQFQDHTIIDNTYAALGANSVYAADMDNDGDMDVLSASWFDNKIAWYENTDGLGNFGPQQTITTEADGANTVFASDIDGDGDMDVLSASDDDDKIAWCENMLTSVDVKQNVQVAFLVYPNPVSATAKIRGEFASGKTVDISIYNTTGSCLKSWEFANQPNGQQEFTLNLNNLPPGIYFLRLQAGNEVMTKKVVIVH